MYDFCKFEEDKEYLSFANYKNNFDRTITCFNGGKRFACTGWKVGWVIGPKHLLDHIALMHESVIWNFNSLGQYAMSKCIGGFADEHYEGFESYYKYIRSTYQGVNEDLAKLFQKCKIPLYPALVEGGFSMTLEISEVNSGENSQNLIPEKYFTNEFIDDDKILKRPFEDQKVPLDYAFCRWMACEVGIVMIPGRALYVDPTLCQNEFVRISICKNEDIVERVAEKLRSAGLLE